jgi:hypothetical protein
MRIFIIRLLVVFLLLNIVPAHAQRTLHEIDSVMDMSPDYLPTTYSYIDFVDFMPLKFKTIDTGMISTHQFDPLFRTENIYQSLGISGQAHQNIIFNYQRDMGFLYQTLPYPLFFKKQSGLRFYKLHSTYSKVAYNFSFFGQNELFAEFTRTMKGVTITVNLYTTYNEGSFIHQNTRNICGDLMIHYEHPSSIYGFRASYIINTLENSENGGLANMRDYNPVFPLASTRNSGFLVQSESAATTITLHDFALQNYVNLRDKNDRYFGTVTHNFQFLQNTVLYKAKIDSLNPIYNYFNSRIETNDSTLLISVKNALQWSNFTPFQEESNKRNFFRIAGGALLDNSRLSYNFTSFTSLYVFGRTHIRLFNVMDIMGKASYSLVSDYSNNDFAANASVSWAINREKNHIIGIGANYYRNNPEYLMQYVETNNFRWANYFNEQNIVQLNAFWNYNNYNFSANYYYLNNYVSLSEQFQPYQSTNDGHLMQLSVFVPFRYKNFGTTANLHLQNCSNDVVNVPLFVGKLAVFYIFELFKKRLKIQVGTDLMYNTPYYADTYLPVLHKFYYQQSQLAGNFIYMDANLTVRIDRINFFCRFGNFLSTAMDYKNFTTPNYPVNDYLVCIGISWRFFD